MNILYIVWVSYKITKGCKCIDFRATIRRLCVCQAMIVPSLLLGFLSLYFISSLFQFGSFFLSLFLLLLLQKSWNFFDLSESNSILNGNSLQMKLYNINRKVVEKVKAQRDREEGGERGRDKGGKKAEFDIQRKFLFSIHVTKPYCDAIYVSCRISIYISRTMM